MRTVLIVNDDPDFLDALAQVLELDNYRVASATNCDDALRLVATARPQAIISDFNMRGGDGVTLFERLQQQGLRTQVPKVLLSSSDGAEVRRRLQAAGLDIPILNKADSVDRLLDAIRERNPGSDGALGFTSGSATR